MIIGVTLVISAALFLMGVLRLTAEVSPAQPDEQGLAAAQSLEKTEVLKIITVDNNPAATPKEAPQSTDKSNNKIESEEPTYTASTIPQVSGVERLSETADSIRIGWDEIAGVKGYRIYRRDDNEIGSKYAIYSVVNRAGLNIRDLAAGSKYSFKIAAFTTDGETTTEGEATEVTFGTSPTDVENFRTTAQTKTTTTMTWEKNERADGYLLQRCSGGKWSEYKTFDADTTEFTDTSLKGGKAYYYRICAFREDSTGKLFSATSDIYTVAGLLGPADKGSSAKLGRISLDYKKSSYADGYEIYYCKDKESFELITTTKDTHCSTARLENGETYYFRIYPYKNVGKRKVKGSYTELEFTAKTQIYDKEVGDTYVEVSLNDQHVWYIVDGDVYLEGDCVTGNYNSADTPKGFFYLNNKMSPCTLKGDDYVSYVTYWMPFIGGGWGLHDASWRNKFGGNIYKGDGSHGCVNLPTKVAKKLYAHIEIGTPVIVY